MLADAYLGKRLQDLLTLAHSQMKTVYEKNGLKIPVEGSSTLHILAPGKRMALTEIARALGQSHQLIAQRLGKLRSLDLIEQLAHPDDKRCTLYTLTPAGEEEWRRLDQLMATTAEVNRGLYEQIGCNLVEALDAATKALERDTYPARFEAVAAGSTLERAAT